MSISKQRAELLQELIKSTADLAPGHPQYDAVARSCKDQIDFHSFLDTHPDVVTAEYAQLKERLEDNAQFDKVSALDILSTRLQNLNLASSQLDFASRQLSFLLAASRNVLRTVLDPEILAPQGLDGTTATATHPSEWTDDEDDSDAEWWANEVPYSPEDGLSLWSGDEEEEEGDGQKIDTNRRPDDSSSLPAGGVRDDSRTSGTKPFITDPSTSPLTPLAVSRTAQRSPTRGHSHHQGQFSLQQRVKRPYSATSLAVWLAAKDSGGHPARQLDPRRCFTDGELVIQVINMLKGLQIPGLAFKFDVESETYRVCRGVHTSDLPPTSTSSLLATFASLATHLRSIQTFCDAIVFTSAASDTGNYQKESNESIKALRALPTVAAFAAAVAHQVVAIRGQLVELETETSLQDNSGSSMGNINLLSLRLKLALMNRQVAALHAVVKTCHWRGTAPCTAAALLNSLYSVLETQLMRSGQHSGAVSAMLVEIFCAAWKPMSDALDGWLSTGSLAAAPPEFYIVEKITTNTSNNTAFWSDKYQLQRWTPEEEVEDGNGRGGGGVAAPALVAPLAESLLHAGLASVGLHLSQKNHQKLAMDTETWSPPPLPPLHEEFVLSLRAMITSDTAQHDTTLKTDTKGTTVDTMKSIDTAYMNNTSNRSHMTSEEDGVCVKEWTAAVSRSPATVMVPVAEDISDLSLFPTSPLDLPSASMCPETTALLPGSDKNRERFGEGEATARHPVAAAMLLASSARAQQAAAGKTDALVSSEFVQDGTGVHGIKEALKGALTGGYKLNLLCTNDVVGRKPKLTTTTTPAAEDDQKQKKKNTVKLPLDASSWAASLPLQVLTRVCLIDSIHHRMQHAEHRACRAVLQAGLLTQLKTMETVAAASGPVLDPFVQYVLRNSSTPRGVDGLSAFELNAALAGALVVEDEIDVEALPGLASLSVTIAPSPPASMTPNNNKSPVVSSLNHVVLTLLPSWPLNLIATDSFLKLHTTLWTLSLQLQWVAQSLIAARVALWKENQNSTTTGPATRAAQQEMLHLVKAVRQHVLTHLESTGARMRRAITAFSSLRDMEEQCRVYEKELRLGCLLGQQEKRNESNGQAADVLHSSLLEVLESSLRHCIILGHARQAVAQVNRAKTVQLEAEDAEEEALALESLEVAEERLSQVLSALGATEREFEGHRVAFMQRVSAYGSEAGAHSDAARALLAAVDAEGRWQPKADDGAEEN